MEKESRNKRVKIETIFEFLDELRDSGKTNMYGAVPYLTETFGMNNMVAKSLLKQWMKQTERTYSE